MQALRHLCVAGALATLSGPAVAEITGNASVTKNYLWRGLTQTSNDTAIQGGLDYTHESGFYAGTWVSNVNYGPGDVFSYEHDVYFGIGGGDEFTWDAGWLYYNYDDEAEFDFHEIYGTLGWNGVSATAFILSGTEADEAPGQDFGFGSTYYLSLDYGFELSNGLGVGLHVGRHAGDFNEAFNGVPGDYTDFNVSVGLKDFTFTISQTDLSDTGPDGFDNDSVKFVIGYSFEFGLDD
jgi:uncharacterized protein (TIGR02001 family)